MSKEEREVNVHKRLWMTHVSLQTRRRTHKAHEACFSLKFYLITVFYHFVVFSTEASLELSLSEASPLLVHSYSLEIYYEHY